MFNLFCPFFLWSSLRISVLIIIVITIIRVSVIIEGLFRLCSRSWFNSLVNLLFPSVSTISRFFLGCFLGLAFLNLIRLVCYSYPVTTTLSFNLTAAFLLWLRSIIILTIKIITISRLLPSNSPWYLISFLRLVELVRIVVRPVTLCFRLLANMSAGHIILSLICKLPMGTWILGVLFGVLELIVSVVQSFVFLILIRVYFEEVFRH